jgi:hypothetical protein
MSNVELITKAKAFLVQCGSCDAGLATACVCPPGDPRSVISELVEALSRVVGDDLPRHTAGCVAGVVCEPYCEAKS